MFRLIKKFFIFSVASIASSISFLAWAEEQSNEVFGIDMSIEGLRSQAFSNYIFIFLILSLILFSYIIYLYLPKKEKLKTGEKIMFGSIIMGVILAVIIGYVQLIEGYLL
ncbi:MAG: hypothetical protein OEZ47_12250 [Gammaproteobacteria bacterium]|nr:hypothetical protein [Gammaproteobacteria bacterium]